PVEIFWEFCRLVKTSAVEIIPFFIDTKGNVKILLTKRAASDQFWPNLYHNPGCVIRPNDTLEMAVNRVLEEELGSPSVIRAPVFSHIHFTTYTRGESIGLI